jgi:hypothetical protein
MDFIDLEASFEPPVVATDAEDPSVRVSKDSFVSSLVYLIGAHIIYEYYITYNIFVFALRLIQLVCCSCVLGDPPPPFVPEKKTKKKKKTLSTVSQDIEAVHILEPY